MKQYQKVIQLTCIFCACSVTYLDKILLSSPLCICVCVWTASVV
jgi:hypothetical protein